MARSRARRVGGRQVGKPLTSSACDNARAAASRWTLPLTTTRSDRNLPGATSGELNAQASTVPDSMDVPYKRGVTGRGAPPSRTSSPGALRAMTDTVFGGISGLR
jgi:hypothetical protein